MSDRPIYLLHDQPMCCPECGARTEFEELSDGTQDHHCPACGYEFLAEEDPEFGQEF